MRELGDKSLVDRYYEQDLLWILTTISPSVVYTPVSRPRPTKPTQLNDQFTVQRPISPRKGKRGGKRSAQFCHLCKRLGRKECGTIFKDDKQFLTHFIDLEREIRLPVVLDDGEHNEWRRQNELSEARPMVSAAPIQPPALSTRSRTSASVRASAPPVNPPAAEAAPTQPPALSTRSRTSASVRASVPLVSSSATEAAAAATGSEQSTTGQLSATFGKLSLNSGTIASPVRAQTTVPLPSELPPALSTRSKLPTQSTVEAGQSNDTIGQESNGE